MIHGIPSQITKTDYRNMLNDFGEVFCLNTKSGKFTVIPQDDPQKGFFILEICFDLEDFMGRMGKMRVYFDNLYHEMQLNHDILLKQEKLIANNAPPEKKSGEKGSDLISHQEPYLTLIAMDDASATRNFGKLNTILSQIGKNIYFESHVQGELIIFQSKEDFNWLVKSLRLIFKESNSDVDTMQIQEKKASTSKKMNPTNEKQSQKPHMIVR